MMVVQILVESGSESNVIDRALWEEMKQNKMSCKSRKCTNKLYPYTSMVPLQTVGCFTAAVNAGGRKTSVGFVVIEEKRGAFDE